MAIISAFQAEDTGSTPVTRSKKQAVPYWGGFAFSGVSQESKDSRLPARSETKEGYPLTEETRLTKALFFITPKFSRTGVDRILKF